MSWRRFSRFAAAAAAAWSLGILLGWALDVPAAADAGAAPDIRCASAGRILSANVRVLAGCLLGIVTWSLASCATLLLNGVHLGVQWQLLAGRASGGEILMLLAPHGLLEVPGILIAGAVGMMGGPAGISFFRHGSRALRLYARPAVYGTAASFLLLLAAALVESWNISRM
ncbi:MAG: stage II sporulation protein M [Acidobacteriota bacterium]